MLPLAACGDNSLNWTENVLLPDGRTVTLTRHQEFKGPHEPGQPPTTSAYWFEFVEREGTLGERPNTQHDLSIDQRQRT